MSLTAVQIGNLTDDELLRVAYAEQDALTSTPLEIELALRLTAALTELSRTEPVCNVMDEFGDFTSGDLRDLLERVPDGDVAQATRLLSVLLEEEQHSPDALRKSLQLLAKFEALTDDPAKALEALETLFNTATA